jgi:hypothetical protein
MDDVEMNRLAAVFGQFGKNYEFPHSVDPDWQGGELGIPESGKLIHSRWAFDRSEDGYEWAANLGHVEEHEIPSVAVGIVTSEPIRGVTERIVGDRIIATGSRDALSNVSDAEIQRGYMDDVSRISASFRRLGEFFGKGDK